MKIVKLVLLATVLLALAACRPVTREGATAAGGAADAGADTPAAAGPAADVPGGDSLAGTSWTLATLNGEAPLADTEVTLNFEDGQASGTDGCNRFSTAYTADGDTITIDPSGASTMMACPEPVMNQAAAFMAALTSAATFVVDETGLSLIDSAGATVATFAPVSSDLAGSSWNVTSINNGNEAVVGVLADTTLTIDFGAGGAISGSAGCNSFSGSYTSDDAGAIEIGMLASTMMACMEPEGAMEQEAQFLAALMAATVYTIDGSTLELRNADGALQVMAVAAAEAAAGAGEADSAVTSTDTTTADGMAGMASVTGTVYYLQRSALPPDAMVEVSIHNKQIADAPPEMTLLGQTAFTADGAQVPLPFTVIYSPEDVQEGALYSIGATIRDGAGKLLFVSTTVIPVITKDNPTENVEILVSPVQ